MSYETVRIKVNVEHVAGNPVTEVVEIDRAEWDGMTPKEQEEWCDAAAEEVRDNVCTTGYTVLDD